MIAGEGHQHSGDILHGHDGPMRAGKHDVFGRRGMQHSTDLAVGRMGHGVLDLAPSWRRLGTASGGSSRSRRAGDWN
jgi:hypothetical protein